MPGSRGGWVDHFRNGPRGPIYGHAATGTMWSTRTNAVALGSLTAPLKVMLGVAWPTVTQWVAHALPSGVEVHSRVDSVHAVVPP